MNPFVRHLWRARIRDTQRYRRRVITAHLAGCDDCRLGRKRMDRLAADYPIRPRWLGAA